MGTARSRRTAVLVGLALVVGGCGGDDPPPPAAADLVDRLVILKDQQSFTDAQVRCVADAVEAALDEGELETFAGELTELEQTDSIEEMSAGSRQALTQAITDCAVEGG